MIPSVPNCLLSQKTMQWKQPAIVSVCLPFMIFANSRLLQPDWLQIILHESDRGYCYYPKLMPPGSGQIHVTSRELVRNKKKVEI